MNPAFRTPALPWKLLPLAALLGGCNGVMPRLPGDVGHALDAATVVTSTPGPLAPSPDAGRVPARQVPPLRTREPAGMGALFSKGTVTGVDLLPELRAFRRLSAAGRTAAFDDVFGAGAAAPASDRGVLDDMVNGGLGNAARAASMKLAMNALESSLKAKAMDIAFAGLQEHLDRLIGDGVALRAETIALPKPQGLNAEQMQRAVTMAAIVVATRISGRMLKQAQQDLLGLESEYQLLIERREKAAALLQQALATGLPANARRAFNEADLRYLRDLAAREGVAGFVKDMGAQTRALQLVALTRPGDHADYQARAEGLTKRQTAALRTVSGVVAFGGLLVTFGHEMTKFGKQQPMAEVLLLGPLALAFVGEVPTVLEAAYGALSLGLAEVGKSGASFRVTRSDGTTQEVAGASEVFDLLARYNASNEWQRAMFRDGGRGLLQQVYQCNAPVSAQMLDAAIPLEQRHVLARELGQAEPENFLFTNAFADPRSPLPRELLGQDHRPRLADRRIPLARAQALVAGLPDAPAGDGIAKPGYLKWSNEQLLALVFSNRDGQAARFAAMQIQGVTIRPVPSMQSLYAYESQVDACRRQTLTPTVPPQPPRPTRVSTIRPSTPGR